MLRSLALCVPPFRRLHNQRNQLVAERDRLAMERDRLVAERDQLAAENNNIKTIELLRYFMPYRPLDFDKIRVGRNGDGGYVMLDDFASITQALSLGVGHDCSWDLDVAERGIDVHMYDHSIDEPPLTHRLFHFNKLMIDTTTTATSVDLGTVVSTLIRPGEHALLKIDIEGSEWDVLDHCNESDFARFSQIVCEFHWFSRTVDPAWTNRALRCMRKLATYFTTIHIHGNNYAPMSNIAGVPFPEVIEVTFVNRIRYRTEYCSETFPTSLDFPNCDGRPDLEIGTPNFDSALI